MLEFFSILAVGVAGGVLPLAFRWSDRQFHAALALASGVFLGAVFLHLLPMVGAAAGFAHADLVFGPRATLDALDSPPVHDHDGDGVPEHPARAPESAGDGAQTSGTGASPASAAPAHSHGSSIAWLWVLVGVVGVYFVEALIVPGRAHHPHQSGCEHAHGDGGHLDGAHGHAGHGHGEQGHQGHEHREHGDRPHGAHAHAPHGSEPAGHAHPHGHGAEHAAPLPHAFDRQRHRAVGWAALVGLTVHSLTSGVALAAVAENERVRGVMLGAILAHKGFESFSLASVFSMTSRHRSRVLAMVVAFSLVTPVGLLLGHQVTALFGTGGIAMLTAIAAGTFLYVCIGELLPEVFHQRDDVALKIALLSLGVGIMYAAHELGGA